MRLRRAEPGAVREAASGREGPGGRPVRVSCLYVSLSVLQDVLNSKSHDFSKYFNKFKESFPLFTFLKPRRHQSFKSFSIGTSWKDSNGFVVLIEVDPLLTVVPLLLEFPCDTLFPELEEDGFEVGGVDFTGPFETPLETRDIPELPPPTFAAHPVVTIVFPDPL